MRRCKDNWVNATQILKLCNFPKAKRTKILEKGVQQGQHEKVQGGYGRFQGTWIPLPEARNLANEYGITSDMVPVLYIDPSDTSVIIPKKKPPVSSSSSAVNKDGTPVKRKYVKKNKKNDTPKNCVSAIPIYPHKPCLPKTATLILFLETAMLTSTSRRLEVNMASTTKCRCRCKACLRHFNLRISLGMATFPTLRGST